MTVLVKASAAKFPIVMKNGEITSICVDTVTFQVHFQICHLESCQSHHWSICAVTRSDHYHIQCGGVITRAIF